MNPKVSEDTVCPSGGACFMRRTRTSAVGRTTKCTVRTDDKANCAPINCRLRRAGNECRTTTKVVNVTVEDETCDVCPSEVRDVVVPRQLCTRSLSRRCPEGAEGNWVKRCASAFRKPKRTPDRDDDQDRSRKGHHNRGNDIRDILELFEMTAGPVRELLHRKNNDEEEDVEENNHAENDVLATTVSPRGKGYTYFFRGSGI